MISRRWICYKPGSLVRICDVLGGEVCGLIRAAAVSDLCAAGDQSRLRRCQRVACHVSRRRRPWVLMALSRVVVVRR